MDQRDDRELVQAAIAGDKAAYGQLYDRYAPLVRAVCYDRTGNLADAQDLAQDAFLRAYERLGRPIKPERFGAWIVTTARLRCREWSRQKAREHRRHVEAGGTVGVGAEPAMDDRGEMLWRMISQLPEKERLAMHVFYLQGNSTAESCRIVGLSRSGFYRALDRARRTARPKCNSMGPS